MFFTRRVAPYRSHEPIPDLNLPGSGVSGIEIIRLSLFGVGRDNGKLSPCAVSRKTRQLYIPLKAAVTELFY
jgi:hypothetical protein